MALLSRSEFEKKTNEVIANINDLNETIAHYAKEKTINQVTPAFKGCRFDLPKNGFVVNNNVGGLLIHSLDTFPVQPNSAAPKGETNTTPTNEFYLDLIFSK